MSKNNRYHLIVIGLSGSGKGKQSDLLSVRFRLMHISVGDILRQEVARKTPVGLKIAPFVNLGRLVPDKLVIELVRPYLQKAARKGFVLDGLPRTINQAKILDRIFLNQGVDIDAVLLLEVSGRVVLERRRKVIEKGGRFQGDRQDDSLAAFKKRFGFYKKTIGPLVDFYSQKGLLVRIDGQRRIETIHRDIVAKLEKLDKK